MSNCMATKIQFLNLCEPLNGRPNWPLKQAKLPSPRYVVHLLSPKFWKCNINIFLIKKKILQLEKNQKHVQKFEN